MYDGLPAMPSIREMSESDTKRDTEIDDAHVAVLREHYVRWLDVAMDHAARMA